MSRPRTSPRDGATHGPFKTTANGGGHKTPPAIAPFPGVRFHVWRVPPARTHRSVMNILAGTSGFAYGEWKGRFYPEKLPARAMLSHYAGELPAVEINNTFYRLPSVDLTTRWAERVPGRFRFSIKASRRITHFKRLGPSSADEVAYLVETCAALGPRLGAILFQLPPTLKKDASRLAAFAELLPDATPAAFEFRHPSWFDDEVRALLADRDFALVHADADERPPGSPSDALSDLGNWGYLRMRRPGYTRDELEAWMARVQRRKWEDVYVFFKHEDEAAGPAMAKEFMSLAAPSPDEADDTEQRSRGGRPEARSSRPPP